MQAGGLVNHESHEEAASCLSCKSGNKASIQTLILYKPYHTDSQEGGNSRLNIVLNILYPETGSPTWAPNFQKPPAGSHQAYWMGRS